MPDSERVLNSEVTTRLAIVQRDEHLTEVPVDADATPTAEIRLLGVLVSEIPATSVTRTGVGAYEFTWTPVTVGTHVITWSFAVGGEDYESEETVGVVAEVEGASDSGLEADASADEPDLGTAKTCLVTASFYDAAGDALQGVFARFTPVRETSAFLSSGVVAGEVTASSGEDGKLSFYAVRGVEGMLSVTGLGIVRRVTIPNCSTITLQSLVETGDDLLEVQRPTFYKIPRRSP